MAPSFRTQLISFYKRFAPAKLKNVDAIVGKYGALGEDSIERFWVLLKRKHTDTVKLDCRGTPSATEEDVRAFLSGGKDAQVLAARRSEDMPGVFLATFLNPAHAQRAASQLDGETLCGENVSVVLAPPMLLDWERKRLATALECLNRFSNLSALAPPSDRSKVTLAAVDVEAWEQNQKIILEIGLAFVTLPVVAAAMGASTSSSSSSSSSSPPPPPPTLQCRHLIISPHQSKRNGRYVADNKHNFLFGRSEEMNIARASAVAASVLNGADIVVGHAVKGDLKWLRSIGVLVDPRCVVDTQVLYSARRGVAREAKLSDISASCGLRTEFLHNGANDSYFTLASMLRLCGHEFVEPPRSRLNSRLGPRPPRHTYGAGTSHRRRGSRGGGRGGGRAGRGSAAAAQHKKTMRGGKQKKQTQQQLQQKKSLKRKKRRWTAAEKERGQRFLSPRQDQQQGDGSGNHGSAGGRKKKRKSGAARRRLRREKGGKNTVAAQQQ